MVGLAGRHAMLQKRSTAVAVALREAAQPSHGREHAPAHGRPPMTPRHQVEESMRPYAIGLTLLLGAAVFAVLRGIVGVTFNATPLLLGLVVVAAMALRGRQASWGAGLVLTCWGAAVLLVREGPLPDGREAAAFLVAAGIGLLLAGLVVPAAHRGGALMGGALTLVYGGLAFYFAFDTARLLDWPVWTIALVLWASVELVRARRQAGSGD
jgi:hypothetical protein